MDLDEESSSRSKLIKTSTASPMKQDASKTEVQDSAGTVGQSPQAKLFPQFQPLYALYHLLSLVFIWSAIWCFADGWATGQDLTTVLEMQAPLVPLRHLAIAIMGLTLLSLEDTSLQVLITMKTSPVLDASDSRQALFNYVQNHFPHLASMYTIVGIALCWCGTWGLVSDIPLQPWLRSLLTLSLGLLMLYIDRQAEPSLEIEPSKQAPTQGG